MAETLVSFSSATVGALSTAGFRVGGNGCSGAAGGKCRAPCWVLKEQPVLVVFFGADYSTGWWGLVARHGLVSHTAGVGPGLVWGCGLWVGCLLRIAQWTRASLWSSCQGRTVDALAPGADEGRGRPR